MTDLLPPDMLAVEIAQPGGPEVLRPVRRPLPVPGAGEVLVRVAAAGINRPDLVQRQGHYPPPPGASDLPGLEIAGTVVAGAEGIGWPAVGERVCALVTGGGYAEYCLASAALCLPLPGGLDELQAAPLPEACYTVWTNVFERGRLAPGEALLVHGGSSGIGVTAIQIARALGSAVYATAGSAEKCRACEALGAVAIDYRSEDFAEAILRLTGGHGVDVILDMVGGDYLPRNLACLASDGRLVQIAVQGGSKAEINLWTVMAKRLSITGSTLRARSIADKAAIAAALRQRVWPLLESGAVKPVIHAVFPLQAAAEAHRLMESGRHIGKLVLQVAE